ncbi:NUDIX hydrolase [Patescibacteria group bacterium]|nr:NUDIX hydrolase [Patescibacteria group bacterium]
MTKKESAGGVIVNEVGEVVLVFTHTHSWQLPKGTVEPGEEYLEAALREIGEEAGIEPDNLNYVKSYPSYSRMSGDKNKFMTIYYFLFRAANQPLTPSMEILKCRWVPIAQVAEKLTYKEDQDFFRSIQNELLSLASEW